MEGLYRKKSEARELVTKEKKGLFSAWMSFFGGGWEKREGFCYADCFFFLFGGTEWKLYILFTLGF